MAAKQNAPALKVGDRVIVPNFGNRRGKIVECWGALAPGGKQAYRVRVRRKPTPLDIDLTEDQIELLPTAS